MIQRLRICETSMRGPVCYVFPTLVLGQGLPQKKYTSPLHSSVPRGSVDNLACEKGRRCGRYKLSVPEIIACSSPKSNSWLPSSRTHCADSVAYWAWSYRACSLTLIEDPE